MKKIKDYVDRIAEELNDAKEYIEKALWYKAKNNSGRYAKYKEMAVQELSHADIIHQIAVEDIEALRKVYPEPPQDMMDKWEHEHKEFIEKTAWIKQMINM